MPRDLKNVAIQRSLTQLGSSFRNHPQATEVAGAIYVCLGLGFIIIAAMAAHVEKSVLIAYVIGLAAVGLSGYTLKQLRALRCLALREAALAVAPSAGRKVQPRTELIARPQSLSKVDAEEPTATDILEQVEGAPADSPLNEPPADAVDLPVTTSARPLFKRSPVLTIPHRKIGLIVGELTAADGTSPSGSPEDLDELRLAHAVAYATKNEAAQDRSILIMLSRKSFETQIIDEFIDTAPELADRIVFQLPENVLYDAGQDLLASIQYYRGFGIRFAARKDTKFKVADFIAHRALWSALSYILMPAKVILGTSPEVIELLEPLGAKLIAEEVSSNDELLEILDYSVTLAAGPHFERTAKMGGPTPFSSFASEDTEHTRRLATDLVGSAAVSPGPDSPAAPTPKRPRKSRSATSSSKRSTTVSTPKLSRPKARRVSAKKASA